MQHLRSNNSDIYFGGIGYQKLNSFLSKNQFSIIFVLVDENTHEHCLPYFLGALETKVTIEIIEIESGEVNKTIETCAGVWNAMSELNGDRKSLMINLGGGVITDMGGFIASTFKRGIEFINVPTTLLSMVDASVGGKTGVDLGSLKNQVGVFNEGEMVIVDPYYLSTLPDEQLRSGYAEILKHALITSDKDWQLVKNIKEKTLEELEVIIIRSVHIKNDVVLEDALENGLRKTLNFGHTLGHAVESYFLAHPEKELLLHGEAIAIGMILATHLSKQLFDFPEEKLIDIKKEILSIYDPVDITEDDLNEIKQLLIHDKKNSFGNINFVLLSDIGKHLLDVEVREKQISAAFAFYRV
ncbi:3-dehydroquinate synthase [Spongiivirga sp. MCCC 1A20706]|uniref:3-dehydroquinate synthase n=1 Tax=Spongiivirga sp. MCCC 1A20706 TaxID=3160963 RepID=UPI003977C2CD